MTIPMARSLMRELDAVDGYRDAARMIVEGILDIAVAGGLVKRGKSAPPPPARPAAPDPSGVLIPDLRAVAEAALLAEGWQPPA